MYGHPEITKAMCDALRPEWVALCVELSGDGVPPEWVELIPAGPEVVGRDGRAWKNDQPKAVIEAFNRGGIPIPIDWEHATEVKAPKGEPAPAAGWIEEIEARDGGAIWGRVVWTANGHDSVANREYRFLSPVFLHERKSGRILKLMSAALTNTPNLYLKSLNREEEPAMPLSTEIRQALGLDENATDEQAVAAINKLHGDLASAQNRANQNPSLDKYVPRTELDTALERARNAEQRLQEIRDQQHEAEIDAVLDKYSKHYPPAKREHYKAMCKQEGGVELFEKIMDGMPEIAADTDLDGKKPESEGKAMNAEEQRVAEMFGNSLEDIKKYGQDAA